MRVEFGEYQLDTKTRTLQREGRRTPVQSKAFDLLAYLIERRERVVSSDELLDALWPGLHVTPAALSTAVQKARQAVGDDGGHQAVIHTEHGKGFRFVADVVDLSPPGNAEPAEKAPLPIPERDRRESAGATQLPLIAELKRRNVFRVAAAYGVVAWLLVEVASVVLPTFNAPEWVMQVLTFLVILGFPLALILAWAFELTPEGIKLEKSVDRAKSITQQTGRKLDFAIIGLLALAVVFLVVDHYVLEAEPEQVPAVESVASGKSVAVLPFANMSQDAASEPFTNGIYDDILTHISKIRDLKVIARTTMERLDPNLGIQEIGTKLGVAAVLEGGVQRVGDRVRINVQLNDCETEAHLWAETYDRELTAVNIFAIQSEIARSVADALQAQLSPEEQDRIASASTENLAAYEAYLLGKQLLAKLASAADASVAYAETIDYFQQAIELDPGYALAYVGLAESYTLQVYGGILLLDDGLAKAQAATNKAIELNDRLGEAYNSLAGIKEARKDFEGAEAAYQHALELNPNYATTYHWYGVMLHDSLGRTEEALAIHLKAAELDPLSAMIMLNVGNDLHSLGRLEESRAWYENAGGIDPGFAESNLALGFLFLELGDPGRAEYWFEQFIELRPEDPRVRNCMMFLHLYRGDEAATVDEARKALADSPDIESPIMLLRNHELRAGRYVEARALYEKFRPELLSDDEPEVTSANRGEAVDLALVLFKTGETERAEELLNRSLQLVQSRQRFRSPYPYVAQIFALQGKKQKALSALRQGIDEGWRKNWWYVFKHEPNLESLHDEPEYQAMITEIEADMAAQLARVREMERNGELAPIPEVPTTTTQ